MIVITLLERDPPPVDMATPLIQPTSYGLLVAVLTGLHFIVRKQQLVKKKS